MPRQIRDTSILVERRKGTNRHGLEGDVKRYWCILAMYLGIGKPLSRAIHDKHHKGDDLVCGEKVPGMSLRIGVPQGIH